MPYSSTVIHCQTSFASLHWNIQLTTALQFLLVGEKVSVLSN